MPNKTESTRSPKNKDQENQAQSTTTISNMDREEFQKLQENDWTLISLQFGGLLEKVQQREIQEKSSNEAV